MEMIMKREIFINKMTKRLFYFGLISLFGLATITVFTNRINAQADLKQLLAGDSEKKWQLNEIKTIDKDYQNENFDEDKEFALESELAQIVPEEILFRADGTCQTTYVSQYEDGTISDEDYTAPCEWSVEGDKVEIIENVNGDSEIEESRDQVFWLDDVTINGKELKSKFSLQGNYTAGIEELVYEIDE
jgi:hypothetical protein